MFTSLHGADCKNKGLNASHWSLLTFSQTLITISICASYFLTVPVSVVLISCTCFLTQTRNLSKISPNTSCHAMTTMIGNDSSLDTSTECWWAVDKDKGECWVKWTLSDKLAALPPVNECWSGGMRAKWFPSFHLWLPNTQHSCCYRALNGGQRGAMQQQVFAMCQKNSVMTGCMRREETVNGGTWDEWFSSHQLHKNTHVLTHYLL